MANRTHWLTYGAPTGNERVNAYKWTRYEDGPNESNADEVTRGTIPMELLDLIEGHEHQHEDGDLLLSAIDPDERERIEDAFTPVVAADEIEADETVEKTVDDYGRISIGREHSGETVKVAIEYEGTTDV